MSKAIRPNSSNSTPSNKQTKKPGLCIRCHLSPLKQTYNSSPYHISTNTKMNLGHDESYIEQNASLPIASFKNISGEESKQNTVLCINTWVFCIQGQCSTWTKNNEGEESRSGPVLKNRLNPYCPIANVITQ